jgi:DNA adenine methylase
MTSSSGALQCPGIQLIATTRINNIKQRYDPTASSRIADGNYDLGERARHEPSQMTLFDYNNHTEDEDMEESYERQ